MTRSLYLKSLIRFKQFVFVLFTIISLESKAQCLFSENETITFNTSASSTSNQCNNIQFALADSNGIVIAINSTPTFVGQLIGSYTVYALGFDNTGITGLSIGTNVNSVLGNCYDVTSVSFQVCQSVCLFTANEPIVINTSGAVSSVQCSNLQFALADSNGIIIEIDSIPSFNGQPVGTYTAIAVGYDNTGISGLTIGANYDAITGDCFNITSLVFQVCCDTIRPTASTPSPILVQCIADVPLPDTTIITDEADNSSIPTVTFLSDVSNGQTCPEVITRTYRITDNCSNITDIVQTITINDTISPTGITPPSVVVLCNADAPAVNIASVTNVADNCTINPTVSFVSDVSNGSTCPIVITRTYRITDDCGNFTDVIQTITINDTISPTGTAPPSVVVLCNADAPAINVASVTNVADNCTINPSVSFISDVSNGTTCPIVTTRTYRITDDCGNFTDVTQTITINDTVLPIGIAPTSVVVQCLADVPAVNSGSVTGVSDNCSVNPFVSFVSDVSNGNTCPEIITRTYSITDDCGNQTLLTQTITINDTINPTATNPPNLIVTTGPAPAPDPTVVTSEADNCTTSPIVSWVSDSSNGQICPETITRTYSVTDDCGNQILVSQQIIIQGVPAPISAGLDQIVCQGEQIQISVNNPLNATLSWIPFDPTLLFTPVQNETYIVTANNNGCITSDTVSLSIEELPNVQLTANILSGCTPLSVNFTNNSTSNSSIQSCLWNVGGQIYNDCNPIVVFEDGGYIDVSLTVTSINGCSNSLNLNDYIFVEETPVSSFISSKTVLTSLDQSVEFQNNSTNAIQYEWSFGDGSGSQETNTSHTFEGLPNTSFQTCLIASSNLGCSDTSCIILPINEELIYYIPNTFTPDGNESNNTFQAVFTEGFDPQNFKLLIFNRWGEIIWESNDSSIGWDGTFNGEIVKEGTYVWNIEFKSSINDKRTQISGHVNLIR